MREEQFYCPSSTYPAIVLGIITLFYCLTIEQFFIQVPSEVKRCIKNCSIVKLFSFILYFRATQYKFLSKNIDFILWGKRYNFTKLHFFIFESSQHRVMHMTWELVHEYCGRIIILAEIRTNVDFWAWCLLYWKKIPSKYV